MITIKIVRAALFISLFYHQSLYAFSWREFMGLPESRSCEVEKASEIKGDSRQLFDLYNEDVQAGRLCEATLKLVSILQKDEVLFFHLRLAPRLIKILMEQKLYMDSIEFSRNLGLSRIQSVDREEFEFLMWQAHAFKIPERKNTCVENPITKKCDEGKGLSRAVLQFSKKYPNSQYEQDIKNISQMYYNYESQHELIKLKEFVAQYQGAVHPDGLMQEFIVNFIRGNNRRDDGKVYANCVGPSDARNVQAKCDLVYKHSLLARVLNQALYLESILLEEEKREVYQVIIIHLEELKSLVQAKPELRREIFPTYQRMNFDEVIAKYKQKLL